MKKDAVLSACEKYRYVLTRDWRESNETTIDVEHKLVFVMLNPSTADAWVDDATICACIDFAKNNGCNVLEVVNLFAYRSTDPQNLRKWHDPVGPSNLKYQTLAVACSDRSTKIVVAWGSQKIAGPISEKFFNDFKEIRDQFLCLGINKDGQPKHPLYVKRDTPLLKYRRSSWT